VPNLVTNLQIVGQELQGLTPVMCVFAKLQRTMNYLGGSYQNKSSGDDRGVVAMNSKICLL
jgi:hypothetical protein